MLIRNILGWLTVAIVLAVIAANGLCMLISPKTWLRLPKAIRAQDWMTEEKYGTGFGGFQVRILGGVFLAMIIWRLWDYFLR